MLPARLRFSWPLTVDSAMLLVSAAPTLSALQRLYRVLLGKYGQHTHNSSSMCCGFKIRIEENFKWMVCDASRYGTEMGLF
jgi:hypothetical protein